MPSADIRWGLLPERRDRFFRRSPKTERRDALQGQRLSKRSVCSQGTLLKERYELPESGLRTLHKTDSIDDKHRSGNY
jgi:hypothetical protein